MTATMPLSDTDPRRGAVPHSFSPDELVGRRRTLGASEVPAVLGLDKYRTPFDVWMTKRGLAPDFEGNAATEWGLRMEPAIRQKVADVFGVAIEQPGTLIHPNEPWLSATPDGLFTLDGELTVLEMKNKNGRQRIVSEWGESGTDNVPFDIAAQVYGQMLVTGVRQAYVAALFDTSDFRLYPLTLDREVAAAVFQQCRAFWHDYVVAGVQPIIEGSDTTAAWIKTRFQQLTGTLREATPAEVEEMRALAAVREQMKQLEYQETSLANRLKVAIGEDAGIVSGPNKITWKATKDATRVDYAAAFEDVCTQYVPPAERLRIVESFTRTTPGVRRFLPTFK